MAEPDVSRYPIALLADILDRVVDDAVMDALRAGGFGDLTRAHGVIFEMIDAGGSRVVHMAHRARVTKQAMGQLVAAVEAAGYVERIPDPTDGRAQLVRLTERGERAAGVARGGLERLETRWCELLGPARYRSTRGALSALVQATGLDHVR